MPNVTINHSVARSLMSRAEFGSISLVLLSLVAIGIKTTVVRATQSSM